MPLASLHTVALLRRSASTDLKRILYITCLAGLANAALIAIVNTAAEQTALAHPTSRRLVLLYLIALAIYYVANRASLLEANGVMQERLGELRFRVTDKVRRAELRTLERLGRGEIDATLAQEINHLSQNVPLLVSAGQSLFLLVFCLIYIATLSPMSFVVIAGATLLAMMGFWFFRESLNRRFKAVHAREAEMLEALRGFTEGFQEIRLNADKNDQLYTHFTQAVERLESENVEVGGQRVWLLMFSNAFLYGLLGVIILVLPMFFQGYTAIVYKIAAAAMFCVGPVAALASAAHLLTRAEIGLGHVYRLEEQLGEGIMPAAGTEALPSRFQSFHTIEFENATFSYVDAAGNVTFTTGPWNFTLRRGELVFLVGGNGAGKSTTLKLLSGLYTLDAGRVLVDGVPVERESLPQYRELFSAIFSDFHLFDRLYGLEEVDPAVVRALIARMELGEKVDFVDGRFTTLDLSTGQRKRLAMIASLLEAREIYLFDEWAADQDAHFRDVFYSEILPQLKREGRTVIAVTHDDRYWHLCDRRVVMELGGIASGPAAV
jgi:putative ATP-binding cassette transporter